MGDGSESHRKVQADMGGESWANNWEDESESSEKPTQEIDIVGVDAVQDDVNGFQERLDLLQQRANYAIRRRASDGYVLDDVRMESHESIESGQTQNEIMILIFERDTGGIS